MRHCARTALVVSSLCTTAVFSGACTVLERPAQLAAPSEMPLRPVHTFSIVARDPATGELGVAVQSHWFSVGTVVTWAEAGVGAVATQSFAEPAYGTLGLARMRAGESPQEALTALLAADVGRAARQVAFVDAQGRVSAHTGEHCIAWAGHRLGEGYSVQANIMVDATVVPAMAKAYESAEGPLAERLVAALAAGQAAGGDLRGKQSAALLVVAARASDRPWRDRLVDLRVEDHAEPIAELRRLLGVHRAYEHMNAGDAALEKGDTDAALREYTRAAELEPHNLEIAFWSAFALATSGRLDEARPLFARTSGAAGTEGERWRELLRRLPASGLAEQALVDTILAPPR